jgi:ribonucleotide monophosphatase NagD (HAD superfamily)
MKMFVRKPGLLIVGFVMSLTLITGTCAVNADSAEDVQLKTKVDQIASGSKNGFKKIEENWCYIKDHRAAKGLKKIKKKYYFFDSSGIMQSGHVKYKKAEYFFKKDKSGKAAAITNTVKKLDDKVWYFDKKGKKYKYGFESAGNKKADIAAGIILSGAKVNKKLSARKNLERAYRFIAKRSSYRHTSAPSLKNNKWIYKFAYNMVKKKYGQCYGFGSICGVIAKALGYDARVVSGKVTFSGNYTPSAHVWAYVTVKGNRLILDASPDRRIMANGGKNPEYFLKKISKNGEYETVSGKPSKYYPGKTFKF